MCRKTVLIYIMQTEMSCHPCTLYVIVFQILLEWLLKNVFIRGYLNTNEAFFHVYLSFLFSYWPFLLICIYFNPFYKLFVNMHSGHICCRYFSFATVIRRILFVCFFYEFFQSCVCVGAWFLPLFAFGKCFPIWRSAKSTCFVFFIVFFFFLFMSLSTSSPTQLYFFLCLLVMS